jgi:hypothetical protein
LCTVKRGHDRRGNFNKTWKKVWVKEDWPKAKTFLPLATQKQSKTGSALDEKAFLALLNAPFASLANL